MTSVLLKGGNFPLQGLIDKHGYHAISKYAKQMKAAVKEDRFLDASKTESTMTAEITTFTNGIDFYNIAFKCNATSLPGELLRRKILIHFYCALFDTNYKCEL